VEAGFVEGGEGRVEAAFVEQRLFRAA